MSMTLPLTASPTLAPGRSMAGNARQVGGAKNIVRAVRSAWLRCLAWQGRCATRKILGSLDDRILHDIGLHRSEIESVVQELDIAVSRRQRAAIRSGQPA